MFTEAVPVGVMTSVAPPLTGPVVTAPVLVRSETVPVADTLENVIAPVPVLIEHVPVAVRLEEEMNARLVELNAQLFIVTAPRLIKPVCRLMVGVFKFNGRLKEAEGVQETEL